MIVDTQRTYLLSIPDTRHICLSGPSASRTPGSARPRRSTGGCWTACSARTWHSSTWLRRGGSWTGFQGTLLAWTTRCRFTWTCSSRRFGSVRFAVGSVPFLTSLNLFSWAVSVALGVLGGGYW